MTSFVSNIKKLPGIIAFLLLSLVISLVFIYTAWEVLSNIFGWEIDFGQIGRYIPSNVFDYWPILLIVVLFGGMFLKKPFNLVVMFILSIMIVASPPSFLERFTTWADRCVNHGDCSEPADYVPMIRGGTLHVPAGGIITADIVGEVKIPIPVKYCLDIKGDVYISWDQEISNAFIRPVSGAVTRTTIEAMPAWRCQNT